MRIKNSFESSSFSSFEIRTVDATANDDPTIDNANIKISLEIGGDVPGDFPDDGIQLRINQWSSNGERNKDVTKNLFITLRFHEAYGLYKAIGFYLDEVESIKQPKN